MKDNGRTAECEWANILHALVAALWKFNSLKELNFHNNTYRYFSVKEGEELVKGLAGHIGLRKLDLSLLHIGREGWTTISSFLQNPRSKLTVLNLDFNQIDTEGAMIISSGFNGNNVLREFKLTNILEITEIGWHAIFNALKSPHCSVENLDLSYNEITGTAALSLIDALTNCTTVKVLGIAGIFNSGHSRTVLQAIVQLLRSPRCILDC